METIHPQVKGFILFCVQRCGKEWPGLYDEMCRVAGRSLYQQLGYQELGNLGLSFGLNRIDETFGIVEAVTSSEGDTELPETSH
jgi:hypothetical protein